MRYSKAEFETLYTQCFPPSMRLAMSLLHDEDEARDVAQEVFLRLWESGVRVENPQAFTVRAVRNACLNRISTLETREKIRRRISTDSPDEDINLEEYHEEVRTAVKRLLTPRERDVVGKIYADGLSYKETAETLEVSVSAVNKNIVSALKKLRNHFKSGRS